MHFHFSVTIKLVLYQSCAAQAIRMLTIEQTEKWEIMQVSAKLPVLYPNNTL
jgi:hypothetical protein